MDSRFIQQATLSSVQVLQPIIKVALSLGCVLDLCCSLVSSPNSEMNLGPACGRWLLFSPVFGIVSFCSWLGSLCRLWAWHVILSCLWWWIPAVVSVVGWSLINETPTYLQWGCPWLLMYPISSCKPGYCSPTPLVKILWICPSLFCFLWRLRNSWHKA